MPTFPSPSLKFRTVGFPQYGFKANISGATCLGAAMIKPVPGIPTPMPSLSTPFARIRHSRTRRAQCPNSAVLRRAAARGTRSLYPRGPWLRPELCCLGPSSLTPTPSASPAGTLRLRGLAVYTQRLRCAGTPRRPAGPSLLSLPHCPDVPSTLHRWAREAVPLRVRLSIPGFLALSPSRHPRKPASASNRRRGTLFRCGIVRVMLRPVCLPRPPDWLPRDAVTCAAPRVLRTLSLPLLPPSVTRRRWESG
jgi:hypothetical protein